MTRRPRIGGGRLWRESHEGGPVVAAPEVPLQIANLKCWFDSRTTAQMTPPPASGGGVQSWASRDGSMGPVTLSQATPANQPIWLASSAAFGGKPVVQFDGTDDILLAATAADWSFLHSGPHTYFAVWRIGSSVVTSQVPLMTMTSASTTSVGFNISSAIAATTARLGNGSGVAYLNQRTLNTAGHFEQNVSRWNAATYGAGVRTFYASGAAAVTQADTGGQTPSAAAPTNPLRVGGNSTGSGQTTLFLAQLLCFDRELSAAEVASLGTFFEGLYPETPQQIPGLKAWFDSRTASQMDIVSGAVQNWRSRAGSMGTALALSQATAGNRPLYVASAAEFGNRPAVQFDGVDDFFDASNQNGWTFLHDGTGASVFRVFRMDSTGGATQRAWTTGEVATQIGMMAQFTTAPLYRLCNGSGTYVNNWAGPASHGTRDVARWHMWGYASGAVHSRVSGSSLSNPDTGGAPSLAAPTTTLLVGATPSGASPLKGWLVQEIYYDHVLTAGETAALAAWAAAEYGVAA